MKATDLPVLPRQPGCYLFLDSDGTPLYIGKAIDLRSRVSSYFGAAAGDKARVITVTAQRLDFIVTDNEVEALLLESNLIKEHKPRFNVQLKDDKSYPYLKLTNEEFPMLIFTRRVVDDGGTYFGPYPSAGVVRRVQELISNIFPLRQNSGTPMRTRSRPCLRYHMGRCLAPCIGAVSKEDYAEVVSQVRAFLDGGVEETATRLEEDMKTAAGRQDFELAGVYRDRLDALQRLTGYDSDVNRSRDENLDFLGVAQGGDYASVQLFQMRRGHVIGHERRFLTNARDASSGEVLERFMAEFYAAAMSVPPLVLLPPSDLDPGPWTKLLSERAGRRVELRVPQRGDKLELMGMAARNAMTGLESEIALLERRGETPGVKELQELLQLAEAPWRIEGFDISNLMGTHTVSSIVVFEGGRAKRSAYRRIRIRGVDRPDDYYSMHQAVYRRFTGRLMDNMEMPDLLLIDGGKGQLSAARRALDDAGLDLPLVGLAQKQETVISEKLGEVIVPLSHPALRLLINVRDEAHRVAVGYSRKRRGAAMTASVLDDVPGIGPKRRDALLAHFSSVDEIRSATVEQLAGIPGMGKVAATAVRDYFADEAG
ncbi:MAG TPA: excinuclease ABC subunit UvrC [Deinococcales bacterium]|nr:excinuclease ABC subunit UvrC [Deinococcales bacterium]